MPEGGVGAIVDALTRAAAKAGVEVRLNAPVAKILVNDKDSVDGVELADGEKIVAPLVFSNAAVRRTMIDLLGVDHLDAEMVGRIRNMATQGMAARIDFDLSDAPQYDSQRAMQIGERVVFAPDMVYIERAFNAAKYGDPAPRPAIEGVLSKTATGYRFAATAQYAPHDPNGGWTGDAKQSFAAAVRTALDDAAPGFSGLVTGATVTTPNDIETDYGIAGGHWHHGELRIDQLLMVRPFHGASQYRLPVSGLYLCGASAHPGGDVSGAPGWNAAAQALKDGR